MTSLARSFLSAHYIRVDDKQAVKVQSTLANAFEVYLHRIASLVAIIALAKGSRKITDAHVAELASIFQPKKKTGKSFRGGSSEGTMMASNFFGVPHQSYGLGTLNMNSTTVDFTNGEARPPLGLMNGGRGAGAAVRSGQALSLAHGGGHHEMMKTRLRHYLKLQKVTISHSAIEELMSLINTQAHALANRLSSGTGGSVSYAKLQAVLRTKKFAYFA